MNRFADSYTPSILKESGIDLVQFDVEIPVLR